MSTSNVGNRNGWLGRKHTEETKKKISEAHKGKKQPKEFGEKMSRLMTGRKLTEEWKKKIGIGNTGDSNGMWKGDNLANMVALHQWVRRHLPEPELCQICNQSPPYDLANTTGNYTRDFNNWQYLCRRCHMDCDGRMNNLIKYDKGTVLVDMSNRRCSRCDSDKTYIQPNGRPHWYYIGQRLVCNKCYSKQKYADTS